LTLQLARVTPPREKRVAGTQRVEGWVGLHENFTAKRFVYQLIKRSICGSNTDVYYVKYMNKTLHVNCKNKCNVDKINYF